MSYKVAEDRRVPALYMVLKATPAMGGLHIKNPLLLVETSFRRTSFPATTLSKSRSDGLLSYSDGSL